MDNIFQKTGLLITNIILTIMVVTLQAIGYWTAPATDPSTGLDIRDAAIRQAMQYNKTFFVELFIGGLLITSLNYLLLKNKSHRPLLTTIILLLIYLLLTGLSLTYFTFDYVDKNIEYIH